MVAGVLMASGLLIWGNYQITQHYSYLAQGLSQLERPTTSANVETRRLNQLLTDLGRAHSNYVPTTNYFFQTAAAISPNIKLKSVSLNQLTGILILKGTAKTRADLLEFQTALQTLNWAEPSAFPTAQLLSKNNLDFIYSTRLKVKSPN